MVEIRGMTAGDIALFDKVADEVFDNPIDPELASAFLADRHHHIDVGIDDGVVVGFASGVDYIHPEKPTELWINEVGVAPTHHGRGIGKRIIACLVEHGVSIGCRTAWVITEAGNAPARALYVSAGGRIDVELDDHSGRPVLYVFSEDA